MEPKHLKKMRIARSNIRRGVEGAREEWEMQLASLKKKMFAKLNKKQASPSEAQLAFFKPIYADRDFFDLPIIYKKGIAVFKDYHNPIVEYQQRAFSFSESGLKEDLRKKGANTDDLTMTVRNYELGKVCVQVKCDPQQSSLIRSYEIGDIEKHLKDNIKNLWCTECIISMSGVDMSIYRFYDPYCPVGRFYLFPSWQLCSSPVEMDEITFFHLDLSDLLLDMIDEMHEREDMLKEYCKELKLQQLSSISFDIMNIKFWDEQRVARAARDYYHRGQNYHEALCRLNQKLMRPLKKYFDSCLLSHPESIKYMPGFKTENGVWSVEVIQLLPQYNTAFYLEIKYEGNTYKFTFDTNQYSQYAIDQLIANIDHYGCLLNKLMKRFDYEYNKCANSAT